VVAVPVLGPLVPQCHAWPLGHPSWRWKQGTGGRVPGRGAIGVGRAVGGMGRPFESSRLQGARVLPSGDLLSPFGLRRGLPEEGPWRGWRGCVPGGAAPSGAVPCGDTVPSVGDCRGGPLHPWRRVLMPMGDFGERMVCPGRGGGVLFRVCTRPVRDL